MSGSNSRIARRRRAIVVGGLCLLLAACAAQATIAGTPTITGTPTQVPPQEVATAEPEPAPSKPAPAPARPAPSPAPQEPDEEPGQEPDEEPGQEPGQEPDEEPAGVAIEPALPAPAPPQPVGVTVARIGVDATLLPVGLHPDRTLVVPDSAPLAGWYTGAPRPGETGPAVLVGHNFWHGVPGVFDRLHELVAGDIVEVHNDDGSVVRFTVERLEQHRKDAFPSELVYGNTDRPEIRIITCGGPFDRSQGRHLDNIIVFGVRTG